MQAASGPGKGALKRFTVWQRALFPWLAGSFESLAQNAVREADVHMKVLVGGAALVVVAVFAIKMFPDFKRYMKMRAM